MFIYFISITYGIYLSTILDFLSYNGSIHVKYMKKGDIRYENRSRDTWGIYIMDTDISRHNRYSVIFKPQVGLV